MVLDTTVSWPSPLLKTIKVRAGTSGQGIIAGPADQEIVAGRTGQSIRASAAVQEGVAATVRQRVVAIAAFEEIDTGRTCQSVPEDVVAGPAVHAVIAGAAIYRVIDGRTGQLTERFGPVRFTLKVNAHEQGIDMSITGARLGILPLPCIFVPWTRARERVDELGRFTFDVEIGLPGVGRLVRYRGWLVQCRS